MNIEDKEVIERESNILYNNYISNYQYMALTGIELFKLIKERLIDFYLPESKALFLQTIKQKINNRLIKPSSDYKFNTLLFYIQQEIDTLPLFDISQHLDEVLAKAKKENHEFSKERNKVFICYNRNDSDYKDEIKKHFKPFLPKGTVWCDDDIKASEEWEKKIEQAISETKVAIFLVSTEFLASDFVMDKEVPAILKEVEKGYTFPLFIILKPCSFTDIPRLSKYQTVNPPTQEVSKMDENEKAALFVNLVRLTMEILDYGKE